MRFHDTSLVECIAGEGGNDYYLPGKLQVQANLLDNLGPNCNSVSHKLLMLRPCSETGEGLLLNIRNIAEIWFDRHAILQHALIDARRSKIDSKAFINYGLPNFDLIDYFSHIEQVNRGHDRLAGYDSLGVCRTGGVHF